MPMGGRRQSTREHDGPAKVILLRRPVHHATSFEECFDRLVRKLGHNLNELIAMADGHQIAVPEHWRRAAVLLDETSPEPGLEPMLKLLLKVGSEMERRAVLRLFRTLGLGGVLPDPEPWERLARVLERPAKIDTTTVENLEAATAALYRLEERSPAERVFAETAAHLNLLTTFVDATPKSSKLRRRLVVAAGETSALAGWLMHEFGNDNRAEGYYETAIKAAEDAGDGALKANALGYRSYAASPEEAAELLDEAQTYVAGTPYLTTYSWLRGRKAEASAASGHAGVALEALDDAIAAFDQAEPAEERVWTTFFDRARLGSLTVTTYARLHRPTDAQAAAAKTLRFLPPVEKRRAIVFASMADAHAEQGDFDGAGHYGIEALAIAVESGSSVAIQQLTALGARLEASRNVLAVRTFLEQLKTVQQAARSRSVAN